MNKNTNELVRETENTAINNVTREDNRKRVFLCKDSNVYVSSVYIKEDEETGYKKYYAKVYKIRNDGTLFTTSISTMTQIPVEVGHMYRLSAIIGIKNSQNRTGTGYYLTPIVEFGKVRKNLPYTIEDVEAYYQNMKLEEEKEKEEALLRQNFGERMDVRKK